MDPAQRPDATVDPSEVRRAVARRVFGDADDDCVDVRETHISWVFLAGGMVFKLKKPVRFDFVDYGTAERRRQGSACARLRSRCAPLTGSIRPIHNR
jgi:aminoglycoside phosphotransferase family enzyme